ncbi:hypothetical protein AX774_g5917 [Zancudomyces culisetae]|uniref:Uncharacterized protein n=1 Tax=Zancudomyces culisetae TaxID=1213189 RepID=A0A1R1PI08_ZANCU|nr:hypothetical protein AX774_g5917 [Zancudomyces culisetae]|eukprot:OMH80635.1 hypothetical protein AX774_g5917 [Zancudomyces culisetae]
MHSQFKNCITPFNSVTIPNISINNYINRIVYFTNITSEVLLSVLIYFERIIKAVRCADSTKRCDDHLIENNELHRFSSHYEYDMHFSKGFNNSDFASIRTMCTDYYLPQLL